MCSQKKTLLYIGEFPPPYGGVTTKNSLLLNEVLNEFDVDCFNLHRFKFEKFHTPILFMELLGAIRHAERICIGVGHPFRTCMIFRIAKLLHGEAFLKNITVFMMGIGTPIYLKEHPSYISDVAKGNCIFTESETLNTQLADLGITTGRYLPNFRKGDHACPPRPVGDVVHFVYFAQVRRKKGADILLKAVKKLNDEGLQKQFDLAIYGNILPDFANEFEALKAGLLNVEYKGAFDAVNGDVYAELNQYDSSSSSSWREGMSGTYIECKFAGIANIVGDGGLNAECVSNGIDGLVVSAGSVDELAEAMRRVIKDHEMLNRMKQASFDSRIAYELDTWRDLVIKCVLGEKPGYSNSESVYQ